MGWPRLYYGGSMVQFDVADNRHFLYLLRRFAVVLGVMKCTL